MSLNKRELLLALAALGAGAMLPAAAQQAGAPDLSAGRAIGDAYRAANAGEDWGAIRAELAPSGLDAAAIARLRSLAAADFSAGRVFVHEGWRLSRTEGRLFALLAAA
ncbi:hypothetical protein [Terricaulis silvestris]|uniref:Uncharacterized protein n=1 Tax=Terricaulis silvestris TaxID=2686094 RepID=A0A6I6MJL0_9CAUL|nr:hypothetical protein [Terricaulis silvestris]QGZ93328.1 hypothetical protein DSM104635_00137 [Terricaulis silvestris]